MCVCVCVCVSRESDTNHIVRHVAITDMRQLLRHLHLKIQTSQSLSEMAARQRAGQRASLPAGLEAERAAPTMVTMLPSSHLALTVI